MSNGKRLCPIILYAKNQFFMILTYSAALAEYIEHIFHFKCMIVWLFDCLIGKKQRILVLVIGVHYSIITTHCNTLQAHWVIITNHWTHWHSLRHHYSYITHWNRFNIFNKICLITFNILWSRKVIYIVSMDKCHLFTAAFTKTTNTNKHSWSPLYVHWVSCM